MLLVFIMFVLFSSCYKDNSLELIKSFEENDFKIEVIDDNQLADSFSTAKVKVRFPEDFESEDDGQVNFIIKGNGQTQVKIPITNELRNGVKHKEAVLEIMTRRGGTFEVTAGIIINKLEMNKKAVVTFRDAYLEKIEMNISSNKVYVDSNSSIDISLFATRLNGRVSPKTIINTTVTDSAGNIHGEFLNYINEVDLNGKIVNKFSMGADTKIGGLLIVAEGVDDNGDIIRIEKSIQSIKN